MYGGRVMESCTVDEAYQNLRHPYTKALLNSIPRLDQEVSSVLPEIQGTPINITEEICCCPFEPRCQMADESCCHEVPPLAETDLPRHASACLKWQSVGVQDRSTYAQCECAECASISPSQSLVEVRDLKVHFPIRKGGLLGKKVTVKAVDGVDLLIERGKTTGLVGESGCGKTTLGQAILQLCEITSGQVLYEQQDVTAMSARQLRQVRRHMQLIFQDPYASMNPRMRISQVIAEPLVVNGMNDPQAIRQRVDELLDSVGLNPSCGDRFPHEFSGGQRQRVVIARALALNSEFIVCDEPVSSLDVSIQAQIINLLKSLQQRLNLTYLFIAHDLAMVRHISDRVAIMYLGKIVEIAPKEEVYQNPLHPYTRALLNSIPIPDPILERRRKREVLQGELPSPSAPPLGCRFHTRCPEFVAGQCDANSPSSVDVGNGHWVACFHCQN
jgi:oligopeptide/dipeptide ABC transporter ATP-binding protein